MQEIYSKIYPETSSNWVIPGHRFISEQAWELAVSCLVQFPGSMMHREEVQAQVFLRGHFWYKETVSVVKNEPERSTYGMN